MLVCTGMSIRVAHIGKKLCENLLDQVGGHVFRARIPSSIILVVRKRAPDRWLFVLVASLDVEDLLVLAQGKLELLVRGKGCSRLAVCLCAHDDEEVAVVDGVHDHLVQVVAIQRVAGVNPYFSLLQGGLEVPHAAVVFQDPEGDEDATLSSVMRGRERQCKTGG
jgi:hypothetical protein